MTCDEAEQFYFDNSGNSTNTTCDYQCSDWDCTAIFGDLVYCNEYYCEDTCNSTNYTCNVTWQDASSLRAIKADCEFFYSEMENNNTNNETCYWHEAET